MRTLLILCIFSICYARGGADSIKTSLFFSLNANYSVPIRLSLENYDNAPGFGARVGFRSFTSQRAISGARLFLSLDMDRMGIKGNSSFANVYSSYLGFEGWALLIKFGTGFGGLYFRIPSELYKEWGNNTLTEFKYENREINFSDYIMFGVTLPMDLFVKPSIADRFCFDYEYKMMSSDKAWMFWHNLISSLIATISFEIINNISDFLYKKDLPISSFTLKASSLGLMLGYWFLDYEYHNWPWNDDPPFRMSKHTISISFDIKRFSD